MLKPPEPHTGHAPAMYKSYAACIYINTGSLFLIGHLSIEHEYDSCSFRLSCTVIYQTVPSSAGADTVVAVQRPKK